MNVNIYYGGRGAIDDPTLYVINKMQEVLDELHVNVMRYNLYEIRTTIATLPQTLKEADAIILASTVEWIGVGGYMQEFLDACWLYGDKETLSRLYMQPVVMSTTCGEKEGMLFLQNAWELLGGLPCAGICGYVEDLRTFEMNRGYTVIIEQLAENLYRTVHQKYKALPSSNAAVKQSIMRTAQVELTPQESAQLSKYVSDEDYVKQQKEDIEELADLFNGLLKGKSGTKEEEIMDRFHAAFVKGMGVNATYKLYLDGLSTPLILRVDNKSMECFFEDVEQADIIARMELNILDSIMRGETTFQRSFMGGAITARGSMRLLEKL